MVKSKLCAFYHNFKNQQQQQQTRAFDESNGFCSASNMSRIESHYVTNVK